MNKKKQVELVRAVKAMKLLNKAQLISKELHKLNGKTEVVVPVSYIQEFDNAILRASLSPVDTIGDTVYLDFLKKNGIKTIAEPHETGWYQLQLPKK